jgi:ATP-dependent Clp protease adaptor protein ClpS
MVSLYASFIRCVKHFSIPHPDIVWFLGKKGIIPSSRLPRLDTINAMTRLHRHETSVLESQRSKLAPPPLYTVLLLNDDFTPMDFVVHVLQRFFSMNRERATQTMFKVHMEGRGICGTYPRDIAATKVEQVSGFAREHRHPLVCIMEEN